MDFNLIRPIKSILPLIGLLLSSTLAFAQAENFRIQGKVNRQNEGKFIKLYYSELDSQIVDSARIQKGAFTLKGTLLAPVMSKLSFGSLDDKDGIELFLSEGNFRVKATDSLRYARVKGPKLTKEYEKLAKTLRPLDRQMAELIFAVRDLPEGEAKKKAVKDLLAYLTDYSAAKEEAVEQFIAANPNSYVGLYFLNSIYKGPLTNYEAAFPHFSKLSDQIRSTALGKQLQARLLASRGKLAGKPYIDFASTTPEGAELSLKDVVSKNKYTFLDFWASWCGPCRKENPHVVKTFEAFKDKGFTVFSVSLDNDATKWKNAITTDGMPWYHVSSLMGWKEPAAVLYGVRGIPHNMLIDENGIIVATNLRGDVLYEKIQQLMK